MKITRLLSFAASLALVPFIFSSCEEKTEPETPSGAKETLEVSPSSAISFKAKKNADVTLTVTTNAEAWEFIAPDWVVATKEQNTLKVNVKDNDSKDSRVGRIEFTAGKAKKVAVSVMQDGSDTDKPSTEAGEGALVNKKGENSISLRLKKDNPTDKTEIIVKLGEAAKSEITVKVKLDPDFLNEYNHTHGTRFESLPSDAISLGNATLVIPEGQTESAPLEISLDLTNCPASKNFLATIAVDETALPEGIKFPIANKRFNIVAMKELDKKIKNMVMIEVNNTNPLNILEYKLEDGTPFFDVVIVFAANINYMAGSNKVVLHNNPNVQALLTDTDIYLQPLRDAGIKVQLGILPNHTPAGIINLSDKGAEMFAKQVVDAIEEYKLDGVLLDEEYTSGFAESELLTPYRNGMRLVYQLYTQMNERISWDTEISVFDFSWEGYKAYNGKTPGEMIDQIVPNYSDVVSSQWEGVEMSQKAGMSIECNRGYGIADMTVEKAKQMKADGYGWCMWYAFHPQEGGGLTNNAFKVDPAIENAAEGFYGLKLAERKYYYEKLGEGQFSPEKKDRNF